MAEGSEKPVLGLVRQLCHASGLLLALVEAGQRRFHLLAHGNVLNAQENSGRLAIRIVQLAGVEQDGAAADTFEIVREFETVEGTASRQNVPQQLAQLGRVPRAIA